MRALLLVIALTGAFTAAAAAQQGPNARAVYVERRGLIEVDAQCHIFAPSIRDALQISTAQARGALLREGWTNARMRELDSAVVTAARARACDDPRTRDSAASASRTVAQWVNAGTMEFPGWQRGWTARRSNDGWRISQVIDAPLPATFGVLQHGDTQRLSLAVPVARGAVAPTSAQLIMRNPAQPRAEIALPQRVAYGLQAGVAPPTNSMSIPSTRTIERLDGGRSQAVFAFPDTAFRDLLALDPRESVEIRVQNGRAVETLLVEVGDIAAARSFLTVRR
ncbi:MAG: hypothetical protein U1E03_06125 [Hyphomonadaceae bacterium]